MKEDTKQKVERIMRAISSGSGPKKACRGNGIDIKTFQKLKKQYNEEKRNEKLMAAKLIAPKIDLKEIDINFDFDKEDKVVVVEKEKGENKANMSVKEEQTTNELNKEYITENQLEALRVKLGISYCDMAKKCGISHSTLGKFPISLRTYNIIKGTFGVTDEDIKALVPVERERRNIYMGLNNGFSNVKELTDALKRENEGLRATINNYETDINRLKEENENYRRINNGTQKKITELQDTNKKLNERVLELTSDKRHTVKSVPVVKAEVVEVTNSSQLSLDLERAKKVVLAQGKQIDELKAENARLTKIIDRFLG